MKNFTKIVLLFAFVLVTAQSQAQLTLAFQGGEPSDTWNFSGATASSLALTEATYAPNKVTGTKSLVCGGNTGGGNCFASGSGNGPDVARTFTFEPVDISTSNQFARTLTFHWGNRFPACVGTGWDANEDLIFVPFYDGVAQTAITVANGNQNAQFDIHTHTFTHTVPACISEFYFMVYVTTNRADELLFLDNVTLTTPQLNVTLAQPGAIGGAISLCTGNSNPIPYSVQNVAGSTYLWSLSSSVASFTSSNGLNVINVDWSSVPAGTYTISVAAVDACGNQSSPQTLQVTIVEGGTPPTISGPSTMCPDDMITLTSSQATNIEWSTGATTQVIQVYDPGTYILNYISNCGVTQTVSFTVNESSGPQVTANVTPVSCNGLSDGIITLTSAEPNLQYSLNGGVFQWSNTFSGLAADTYTISVSSSSGCANEISVAVTEPAPLVVSANSSGSLCTGETIQLNGSVSMTGITSYSWTGPNGFSSGIQNPSGVLVAGTYHLDAMVGGCVGEDELILVLHEKPIVQLSSNAVCEGQQTVFSSVGTTVAAPAIVSTWSWSFGDGQTSAEANPSHEYDHSGSYIATLTATTNNGCSASLQQDVFVAPSPTANFQYSPLEILISNPTVDFVNSSTAGDSYLWQFGIEGETSSEFSPSYTYPTAPNGYEVELFVYNGFGCADSITRIINIGSGITYYVPNAFTPNGDGINPVFIPVLTEGLDLNEYELVIYNRWGEKVFTTTDVNQGWDGTFNGETVAAGTYVWDMRIKHLYGPGVEKVQGHVTILR